jgi:hypothetical protein
MPSNVSLYIRRFLGLFEDNKKLGKDALKFSKHFKMHVEHMDTTVVGTMEDYYPMGRILQEYGQTVGDFKNDGDALEAVRYLCARNQAEHGYENKPEGLDEKFPRFSKFWFVFSKGKSSEHSSQIAKKLDQDTDIKNLEQLQQAKIFMEGLGFQEEAASSTVQVENEKSVELKKATELVKLTLLIAPVLFSIGDSRSPPTVYVHIYIYIYTHTYTHTCVYVLVAYRYHATNIRWIRIQQDRDEEVL